MLSARAASEKFSVSAAFTKYFNCLSSIQLQNYLFPRYLVAVNDSFLNRNTGTVAPMTIPKMMNAQVSPLYDSR